jgi:hypothetical protein
METCFCGVTLRTFWVWEDANGVPHASAFKPSHGVARAVLASTSRDALLPIAGAKLSKHDVRSLDNPAQVWNGRCCANVEREAVAV